MNLKQRFSIIFSSLFSLLLGLVMLLIFSLFSQFRSEEFEQRLEEKAITSIRLLIEVQEVDYQLLKIIDQHTINQLYNEKLIIFNDSLELIYSSLDDAVINWSVDDLNYLKEHRTFFKRGGDFDLYGMYYDSNDKDYFAMVTAEDKYGNRKLEYLKYLLTGAFLLGTISVWTLSFYLSRKSLLPLDLVKSKIQEITDKNLQVRLPEENKQDEIQTLSHSFNQMLDRIERAYSRQKEFTANASHELRTPIARVVAQLGNILNDQTLTEETRKTFRSISEDVYQLSEVVTSLLLLSRLDARQDISSFRNIRLDEVVYSSSSTLSKNNPHYRLHFEIVNNSDAELNFEIRGDETLLKIAADNLLKNAYSYSDNGQVKCILMQNRENLQLIFSNTGETPKIADPHLLFQPFARGSNTADKPGSGLGLMIVKRILDYHGAEISYHLPDDHTNEIVVSLKI